MSIIKDKIDTKSECVEAIDNNKQEQTMKHTKEPWDIQNKGNIYGSSARVEVVAGVNDNDCTKYLPTIARMKGLSEVSYANAQRIVTCVNALAGMAEAEIAELKRKAELVPEFIEACQAALDEANGEYIARYLELAEAALAKAEEAGK